MLQKHEIKTRTAIYDDERSNCGDNMLVGNIDDVGGIISSDADLLEITFKIDANRLLAVSICGSVIFCCNQKHLNAKKIVQVKKKSKKCYTQQKSLLNKIHYVKREVGKQNPPKSCHCRDLF